MLGRLATQFCSVVPKEAVEKYGQDFRTNPVGTGPFKFVNWKEGELLVLHKNEQYFEKGADGATLPHLDGVAISFIGNKSTEFLKFLDGDLDFVSDLDASLKDQVLSKEGELLEKHKSDFNLEKTPYLNTEYLGFLLDLSLIHI